jgi:hypothetical protein
VKNAQNAQNIKMNINQTELAKLDLPKLLFKYRDWNDEWHKTILTGREVFMASPSSFEDEKDCRIPIRYDLLTYHDIFYKHFFLSLKESPQYNIPFHIKEADRLANNSPFKNEYHIKNFQNKFFNDFFERFGVLSLTADSDNNDMWVKYSNDYSGFCVGFNTIQMFSNLGGGGNVEYYDTLPIVFPTPKHSFEVQHRYQIYSKERKWEFEKEYRTHLFRPYPLSIEERQIKLPPEAYNCIILGKRMDDKTKEELVASIPKELSHIEIIEQKNKT